MDGLPGFLVPSSIVKDLVGPGVDKELEEVNKYQEVDMLTLVQVLQDMKTNKERADHLSERYPALYIFVMKKRGKEEEIKQYMTKCE